MAISEKAVEFIKGSLEKGRAVPGQSLTNSPENPYSWEKSPEFTNPREAMLYVFENLTVPETTTNILLSISNGVGIVDIAAITLYSGFLEGKWNPDLMTLLMEPTMYMLMALAEKADIPYVIESGDDTAPHEMDPQKQLSSISSGIKELESIKKQSTGRVSEQSVPREVRQVIEEVEIQPSILAKVEETNESKNNQSLLGR